jgi:hypothetical protein
MLIVYLEQFEPAQQQLLIRWGTLVNYWPRSWSHTGIYNAAIPLDWWLLFHSPLYADIWLMKYSDRSRIVRTLFD